MAQCKKCGKYAGMFRDQHDECEAPPPPTEAQLLARELEPLLESAARTAGMWAAFTLVGIWIVLGMIYYAFKTA